MVRKFSRYFGRSPDRLGLEDVRAFQVYLVSQGISWPALNQTVCALRFFYGVTLDRAKMPERIAYARTPRKLPAILSADEVVRFLEAVPSLKARTALTTAYAAGLRASEAVSLKVADIDSKRMVIQVHHGKGAKDRTVMLSPQLLTICFQGGAPTSRSTFRCSMLPAGLQPKRWGWSSMSACICYAIASRPICWRAGWISTAWYPAEHCPPMGVGRLAGRAMCSPGCPAAIPRTAPGGIHGRAAALLRHPRQARRCRCIH
jgi:hypothetical protein